MNATFDEKVPLIHRFRSRVTSTPSDVAFRYKSLGIWHAVTWNEYGERVRDLAVTFEDWGLGAGSTIVVIADASPDVLIADLAAQSIGATVAVLPVSMSQQRCIELIDELRSGVVIVGDHDTATGLLDRAGSGGPDRVLVVGERRPRTASDPRVVPFETTRVERSDAAARWETQLAARRPGEPVATVLTFGAGGTERPIALSSLSVEAAWRSSFGSLLPLDHDRPQRSIACVPSSSPAARCLTVYFPLFHADVPHLPEQLRLVGQAVADVQPTIVLHHPDFWERLVAELDGAAYSGPISTRLYRRMVGRRGSDRRALGGRVLSAAIRRRVGLARLELALSAGQRGVDQMTRDRMGALGVEFAEIYQVAEAAGFAGIRLACSERAGYRTGDDIEVRVVDDGQVLLRGAQVAGASAAAGPGKASDDWIGMHDVVELVDGELVIFGREDELVEGPDGRRCGTSDVERALERSPLINRAAVVQLDAGRLGALVEFHDGRLSTMLAESGRRIDGYVDLAADDDAMARLTVEMDRANEWLSTMALPMVEAFEILPTPMGGSAQPDRRLDRARRCSEHAALVERLRSDAGRRSTDDGAIGKTSMSGGTG